MLHLKVHKSNGNIFSLSTLELSKYNLTEEEKKKKEYFKHPFSFWTYTLQPNIKHILHKLILWSTTYVFYFTAKYSLPLIIGCSVVFSHLRPINNAHTNPSSKKILLKKYTQNVLREKQFFLALLDTVVVKRRIFTTNVTGLQHSSSELFNMYIILTITYISSIYIRDMGKGRYHIFPRIPNPFTYD